MLEQNIRRRDLHVMIFDVFEEKPDQGGHHKHLEPKICDESYVGHFYSIPGCI